MSINPKDLGAKAMPLSRPGTALFLADPAGLRTEAHCVATCRVGPVRFYREAPYSDLSAITGSTRMARRAGTAHAASATAMSTAGTLTNVTTSRALTS